MIDLQTILILVWLHFFADFILQTDKIAIAKSSDNKALLLHVTIYTLPFLWFGAAFAVVTWLAHLATDYVSSRLTTKLYKAGERHWFFVVIGADQALHLTALFGAYAWLS